MYMKGLSSTIFMHIYTSDVAIYILIKLAEYVIFLIKGQRKPANLNTCIDSQNILTQYLRFMEHIYTPHPISTNYSLRGITIYNAALQIRQFNVKAQIWITLNFL